MIFILCPDWSEPSGGVKKLYRHAEVLCANGIDALLVHQQQGFVPQWFQPRAKFAYENDIRPGPDDFILVPEIVASQVVKLTKWRDVPKLIINQGAYQTFKGYSFLPGEFDPAYRDPACKGTIVVSEDSRRYLEFAFPGLRIFRIHNSIDPALFYPPATKKPQIALMPRRNGHDALQVINILKSRCSLGDFTLAVIHNMPEVEAARVLRESLVFLNFGEAEGSPLPPAEAMACACLVIGYDGRGGREFITPEYAFPIQTGDIISFASTVERVIRQMGTDQQALREKAARAAQFIRRTYSPEREEADILRAWAELAGVTPHRYTRAALG